MIASVDAYLGRAYERGRYDCLHFARDVWRDATGEDLGVRLDGLLGRTADRHVQPRHVRAFRRLDGFRDPCIVLMHGPRRDPHVGVFLRGRVLHLREEGSAFDPVEVATFGFSQVRCYA